MTPFSLLIKPTSADCNLACQYCFYLDHGTFYPETKIHRMPDTILEKIISSYMETHQPQYSFGWQGGEPTLMGLDFFRKVTDLQQKHGRRGASVSNGLQTNATLIDNDMARHLGEYHFLVGVSIDGPQEIHDQYRTNTTGNGSHAKVMRGIECLQKNDVEFNTLTLISQANVHQPSEIYHYLIAQGFRHLQFIPCIEFDAQGHRLPFSISASNWGDFLCGIFDAWYPNDTYKISIRLFDSLLNQMLHGQHNICHMGRNCNYYFVVEFNGDLYPCDFFVDRDLKIGNVTNISWQDAQDSSIYQSFSNQKTQWNELCCKCEYLSYCSGDCLKHRSNGKKQDVTMLSNLCSGWKQFYDHALPSFRQLADKIKEDRSRQEVTKTPLRNSHIGRNTPCPCMSGKKYKKCCGK